jgi:hypothetical protein
MSYLQLDLKAELKGESVMEPRARHRVNCGQVFDAIKTTTIAADLSAAVDDFTVFQSVQFGRGMSRLGTAMGGPGSFVKGIWFVSEMILEFSCAPSDIA